MLPERSHTTLLADMAQAIRHDDVASFSRIVAGNGSAPGRIAAGLRIHASTTQQTLVRALADAVPTVAGMLTMAAFSDLARDFINHHPPTHAALYDWGDALPEFLGKRDVSPELVAMAQLDRAWIGSLFAAEAGSIGLECLALLPAQDVPTARLRLHPSLRLVCLSGPWLASWLARAAVALVESDCRPGADGCWVTLVRPWTNVRAVAVTRAAYRFLADLRTGVPLLRAYEAAACEDPQFNLEGQLRAAFAGGLIIDCQAGE